MNTLVNAWDIIDDLIRSNFVKKIAFDGCHRIYLLTSFNQYEDMREDYRIVDADDKAVRDFYEESCSLRFVDLLIDDENSDCRYVTIISQDDV